MPSAASIRLSGISKDARPACRSTSFSAANAAKPPLATPTPPAPRSSRPSTKPASSWTRASATCACRWACPAAATGALHEGPVCEPAYYVRRALKLFEECRKQLGDEVELLHDVQERVSPNQAVQFLKDTERFKMFFMEDPLSPEDIPYFHQIRSQCATPIAMGELFNSPHEWTPIITGRLIDYI